MDDITIINISIKRNKEKEGVIITIEPNSKDISKLVVVNIGTIHPFVNIEKIEVEEYKTTIYSKPDSREDIEEALELLQKQVTLDIKKLDRF